MATIQIKKSNTALAVPLSLLEGELAINQKDKKLFYRNDLGQIQTADLILFSTIQNALNLKQDKETVITLPSVFATTATTRANVGSMNFAVTAGKKYKIELIGSYQTVSTTTGGGVGFVLTTGTGNITGEIRIAVSQGTTTTDLAQTLYAINSSGLTNGSFINSSGVSVTNAPHKVVANFILDCITTGVLQLQFGSRFSGSSAQLNAGTTMVVTALN